MKKFYFAIIAFFLTCSISFGQMSGDSESLVPADVSIFVKSKEISKLTKTMNYIVNNLMDEKQRGEFIAKRDEFKKNTGIDYLDEKSLRSAGVDTDRSVSLANFEKDISDDVNLLLIPVLNEDEAVLRFMEVIRRINPDDSAELKNVTTRYKNQTVYELKDKMYVTCVNKYIIVGSTSDIIKKAIDLKDSRNNTLILDENYKDFVSRIGDGYDLNVFLTKRFFVNRFSKGNDEGSLLDSIDYIAAGIGLDKNKIQINASAKFAKDNQSAKEYLNFLKTGVHASSIYIPTADSTMFFSLDYQYINKFCKGEVEWCEQYHSLKELVKRETGIDFDKDLLPYFNGGINIISQDSTSSFGGFGDALVFVPMTNPAKIETLWNNMKKFFQAKYSKSKKFGEEKIGSNKSFWFIDENQMRFFVSYDKRGIYAGNSTVLMKSGLAANTVTQSKSSRYKDIINDKTFYILNIKKSSFLNMFIQMGAQAQGNSNVAGLVNRLGEIFLYSEKNDNFISLNLEIEIKEAKSKK
nr:hypothetical protein [uncultured bacterium]